MDGENSWKAHCNPAALLNDRVLCSTDYNNIYVRLPGLNTAEEEYHFKISVRNYPEPYLQSQDPYPDPSSSIGYEFFSIQSQCGCTGSVGNGAPCELRV